MPLRVTKTDLAGVLLVTPSRHADARGYLEESWSARDFGLAGIAADFLQDNHSFSRWAGTLRGQPVGSPDETAFRKGWIDRAQFAGRVRLFAHNAYDECLYGLI